MSNLLRSKKKKEYDQTCIQRSPYILRLLDNSPKVELYRTVTPLKQMRSGPLQTPKMHDCIIFYLCIKVDKQDYDQVMSKLCYVSSKVHGKMNTSEITKSSNQLILSWQSNGGNYKSWTNSTSSLVYRKLIYTGRPYLKGDRRYRYDGSKRSKLPATYS